MKNKATSLRWLIIALCIIGGGFLLTRQREIVGVDQIGVVVSPGGRIAVYQAGERPLVLPMVQDYVRLTAKPIRYEMIDDKSIAVSGPNKQTVTIGCQVRYQVEDAARLVETQGKGAPQASIEGLIRKKLTDIFNATLQQEGASLDEVTTRVVLVGEIHQTLKQTLTPSGVSILSFDLISW